ncbi:Histone deacetylase complex subunit SAP18 [Heterocephalus glaber]|uniref:Histone deacetylase complex subunit SAP18 n=1 Tax=Heterocephalus glaber TaxID=10181 RepID=G5ATW4_HETGA|nr:Histone deacetylase complex subunit SAP18 [Heterocephalus glaber]
MVAGKPHPLEQEQWDNGSKAPTSGPGTEGLITLVWWSGVLCVFVVWNQVAACLQRGDSVSSKRLRTSRPASGGQKEEDGVTQGEIKKEPEKPIDCEKTSPVLLRVFTTNNGLHHRGNVPSSELQIYSWMDATMRELTSLVKEVYPEARKKGAHFNFTTVFIDFKRPVYRVKEIDRTMSGRKGADDSMTLQ